MEPWRQFARCPRCGAERQAVPPDVPLPFRCESCGFIYFFNAASAVAALVLDERGRLLFIRREREPAKGLLGMPGGFVDAGESAEQAVRREVREEVGLELGELTYLTSFANWYPYAGVTYSTLDLFFLGSTDRAAEAQALDAVAAIEWRDPATVDEQEIAFDSMRVAVRALLARRDPSV